MDAYLQDLDTIELAELNATASLLTRTDRKYLLRSDQLPRLLHALPPDHRVLTVNGAQRFDYTTRYYDTPELRSFHETATRRRRRFKVRTRSHGPDQPILLEVKRRDGRGNAVKTQRETDKHAHGPLTRDDISYVDHALNEDGLGITLRSVVQTEYRRTTLLDPSGAARVTIDHHLTFRTIDASVDAPHPASIDSAHSIESRLELCFADVVTVETKTAGAPCDVDRALWAQHIRPVPMSKFGIAMALTHAELPSNKWARVIRRHFQTRSD